MATATLAVMAFHLLTWQKHFRRQGGSVEMTDRTCPCTSSCTRNVLVFGLIVVTEWDDMSAEIWWDLCFEHFANSLKSHLNRVTSVKVPHCMSFLFFFTNPRCLWAACMCISDYKDWLDREWGLLGFLGFFCVFSSINGNKSVACYVPLHFSSCSLCCCNMWNHKWKSMSTSEQFTALDVFVSLHWISEEALV